MSKELVISATQHETRVAIMEDGQLCEIYVEREKEFALVGSIYKGRVTRVLPGMQSAFVDIALDSDAFLYVTDFLENIEEYDHIVSTVEEKVQRMEEQGGRVFTPPAEGAASEPAEVLGVGAESAATFAGNGPKEPTAPPPSQRGFEPRGFGRRRGQGRRGQRDRSPGRELPPSKFVTRRPYEPPAPAGEAYEPIILPGESLAKYKDRIPAIAPPVTQEAPAPEAPAEPVTGPEASAASIIEAPQAAETVPPETTLPGPSAELAPALSAEAEMEAHAAAPEPAAFATEIPAASAPVAEVPAPVETAPAPEAHEPVREESFVGELTAEEATNLAEQVAEAELELAEIEAEQREAEYDAREGFAEPEREEELEAESEAAEATAEALPEEAKEEATPWAAEEAQPPAEPQQINARVREDIRARFQRPMRRGGRRRGGVHRGRPHERDVAPRRPPQQISDLLKAGQEIIVQIAKEPLGKKGARITSHVALPGRYLVYMPTVDHVGVSRKINSSEIRSRLRRLVLQAKGNFPGGFIVRTAAEGATDEEIRSDVEYLGRTWSDIKARAEQRKAPSLLHRDLDLVERILRDHLSSDYTSIWIDSEEEYTGVVEFVSRFQPNLVNRVKLYTKPTPIFEEFGIQQEIDKALRPKVWLKSGGYIVINHTEALVAIDVNTGKFVGKGSTRLEDTIVKTNLEAVKEIVRQIRLRDLGGIIVIDFIDMEERKNRIKVMQALDEALRADKAPSKVLSFNEFGLVAITRKRTKQALERVLCQPCTYCSGSGMVKSISTLCYEIQGEARKMAGEIDSQSLTLRVHPEIAKALKTRESSLVDELEQWIRKSIIIQADPTLHWEQYDIY
jgi:ribonuclease G